MPSAQCGSATSLTTLAIVTSTRWCLSSTWSQVCICVLASLVYQGQYSQHHSHTWKKPHVSFDSASVEIPCNVQLKSTHTHTSMLTRSTDRIPGCFPCLVPSLAESTGASPLICCCCQTLLANTTTPVSTRTRYHSRIWRDCLTSRIAETRAHMHKLVCSS